MRLPTGVGYKKNDHDLGSGIWVDCMTCGRRDRLTGTATVHITNDAAQKIFESKGWSVLPTRCPLHSAKQEKIHERERA